MTRIALVGDATLESATSRVNRAWLAGLVADGYDVVNDERAAADVLIHHDYRQHFSTCSAGIARRRIAVRTWDFGPFPRAWADRIGRDFDELWVHTEWTRQKALESGVDPHRVSVVPHGVDRHIFAPDGPKADVGTAFTFLFVGATVARKGVDILLRAYAQAFGPDEPVCLILKGHSSDVFYQGQHLLDAIREFQRETSKPRVRHIDCYIRDEDLAALYRAADVGVFPYRAEGFAMPILEAMACGLPCIVPRFGACLDYCTPETAFFVEPRRIRLPVGREFAFNTFGFRELVDSVDFCEVPVTALANALRAAYDASADGRRARGGAAARAIAATWTWDHAIARVRQLLEEPRRGA